MRVRCTLLLALAVLLASLLTGQVIAASAGAAPGELHFDSTGRSQTLYVINTGQDEAQYRVYADGEYASWFVITPDEFSLSAGANREVSVTVSPPEGASGNHTASIRIVAFEPSVDLKVGAGVKIPAYVSIETLPPPAEVTPALQMWIVAAIVVPIVLVAILLVLLLRRKRVIANA
jgi:hypothetical protein